MMRKLLTLSILVTSFNLWTQNYNLPYRVDNLFGVANSEGQIIIKPQFDMIEPLFSQDNQNKDSFFIAYNINKTNDVTSLIINDRIVLKDKHYSDYFIDNQLIYAIEYIMTDTKDKYGRAYTERNYLYTYNGKSVFKDDYKYLSPINIIEGNYDGDEILIFTMNLKDDYALHLFNKASHKITKTFFKNSNYIKHSDYDNYDEKSFVYRDSVGKTRKLIVSLTKEHKIVLKSNKLIKIKEQQEYDDYFEGDEVPYIKRKETYELNLKDSISLKLKKVKIEQYSYLLPMRKEKLEYGIKDLNRNYAYAVIKNNKVGMKKGHDNSIMIPVEYDDIYYAESRGQNSSFITKKNDKYGLCIFSFKKSKIIEPIFSRIPYLSSINYPKKDDYLIKLFDNNDEFFCYANQEGVLYYSKK